MDGNGLVIVGGGVIGCGIAWQLARRGRTDVTVLERRRLTEGSTWHAAGLIGQLRSSAALTTLMSASVQTYEQLEALTGYATGWHPVGSIRVAGIRTWVNGPIPFTPDAEPLIGRLWWLLSTGESACPGTARALMSLAHRSIPQVAADVWS